MMPCNLCDDLEVCNDCGTAYDRDYARGQCPTCKLASKLDEVRNTSKDASASSPLGRLEVKNGES